MTIHVYEDPAQCRKLWEDHWPVHGLFDLWQLRHCFHQAYDRPLEFRVAEINGRFAGFLPLCRNLDAGNLVLFPGETWDGKTWLEQNRLIAESPEIMADLLDSVEAPMYLRYLSAGSVLDNLADLTPDETGYLFYPGLHDYDMAHYWAAFSGKTRKKIRSELNRLEQRNLTFRFNRLEDIDILFRMNTDAFGQRSYFHDPRFYRSFENLAAFLRENGMMRITTVLVDGIVAAVDMGAIFKNSYTLLAGGTHPEFPGIAKVINLHHLEWACRQRFDVVDFLCGDFNWKHRFQLTPRPLFQLKRDARALEYGYEAAVA